MSEEKALLLEARLEELEVRYSFQEELLRELDQVVRRLGDRVDGMARRMSELEGELRKDTGLVNTIVDEVPPHY